MREDFAEVSEACDNTLTIAERCNVELDLKKRHSPVFKPPNGIKPDEFLTKLVYERAQELYGEVTDEVKSRIDRELDVIETKGFASYFLIVWDFCNYARQNNIPVGARGSAVGTVVGYCLGLCDIDPLKYDLLFERFMDPHRNEMPCCLSVLWTLIETRCRMSISTYARIADLKLSIMCVKNMVMWRRS
jgi:DNA polymerase-3 subunit alpha